MTVHLRLPDAALARLKALHPLAIDLSLDRIVGLLAALGLAVVPLLLGDPVLTHYPPFGAKVLHLGTLEFITAVLFDCAVFLLVFGFVVGSVGAISRAREEADGRREAP